MALVRGGRRSSSFIVLCVSALWLTSTLGTSNAVGTTRLRPNGVEPREMTDAGRVASSLPVPLVNTRADIATRIAELTARLAELEGPAKLENPGVAIDDPNLHVNPLTQPVLAEYRSVQRKLDKLYAAIASSGSAPATPVLQNESEPNNTTGTANALVFGSQSAATVAGTIGVAGDVDFYSFSATAGARVWIDVDTGSPPAQVGSSRDSVVDLFDTNGTTVIETDDDDGTGNGADGTIETGLASVIAGRVLPSTGTYFIRVRGFSAATIDPYRVYVHVNSLNPTTEVESNDSAATANPVIVAPSTIGFISGTLTPGDNDFYSASLQAGDRVLIAVDGDPARDGTSTNVRFQLRDTDGSTPLILANSGSTSGGFDAEGLVFDIPVTGTYFVRVFGGAGSTTGDYTLLVVDTDGFNGCTITCPANQMAVENPPGSGGAVVNYPPPTASPACGAVVCAPASGTTFPLGTTTVTCQVQIIGKVDGSIPSCSFTVTVTPACSTLTCPAPVDVSSTPNQCGAVVNYSPPTDAGCGTITCSPASGSSFPIGTTTVTCTSTAGPSCSFTVTVNDTQAPSITCPSPVSVPGTTLTGCAFSAVVTYPTPTVTDNCPGTTVACVPPSGSTFLEGTTTVTCTATDASGNTASCSFTVTVSGGGVFGACYVDDYSGDTWSIVTNPASPLYRYWRYRIAATGEILCGTASYLSYVPGHSLIAYDRDDPRFYMDANVSFGSNTATVTVIDRSPSRRFVLRDRNILNDPPCQ